jgi:hypothetical protein
MKRCWLQESASDLIHAVPCGANYIGHPEMVVTHINLIKSLSVAIMFFQPHLGHM